MTRQIHPHHATPSMFTAEQRLYTVEERLRRAESALAIVTDALGILATELDTGSGEHQEQDGTPSAARRIHDLLAQLAQYVSTAHPGPRPPQASA